LEPPLCVVSNWIKKVYTILVWNTISGSSNLDICCYHCLILTLIFHLKVLINFFLFFTIIIIVVIVVVVLLLSIIYTINLLVVRPRSCRVIYYFDTPALGRRHQSFGRVNQDCEKGFGWFCRVVKTCYKSKKEPYLLIRSWWWASDLFVDSFGF